MLERYDQQVMAELDEIPESDEWTRLDLEGRARVFIQRVVQGCRRRRSVLQLRLRYRVTPGEITLPGDKERGIGLVDRFRRLFAPVAYEIMHEDVDQALAFALRIVDSVVASSMLLGSVSNSLGVVSDEELVERLAVVFTGCLG